MKTKSASAEAPAPSQQTVPEGQVSRRGFLGRGVAVALAGAASGTGVGVPSSADAAALSPKTRVQRANRAYKIRQAAALQQRAEPLVQHPDNGDDARYPNFLGSFTKALPSNPFGEVDPAAYLALRRALESGLPADFEAIPLGGSAPDFRRRLINPQAGLAYDLEGGDSHAFSIPPAPAFASEERAGEILENYWMALLRDLPFSDYAHSPVAQAACGDLSQMADFRGPKINGLVTPQTLFRDTLPGATVGPYISQFLLLPAPFGAAYIEQRMRTPLAGVDFMTSPTEWLRVQRGELPTQALQFDPVRRFIRNGRDLAQWVHIDVLYQAYFHAMLILLCPPNPDDYNSSGLGVPVDSGNPYAGSRNQDGFGTFGPPHIAALLCEVATRALKACWFQKWCVHRTLRPEAYAGRVHHRLVNGRNYPLALGQLENSAGLRAVFNRYGSFLLPMAFPEGSPVHPSYAAGHATVAGACVTILKAWFEESTPIADPVVPSSDGTTLVPYTGPTLTVGGELNKLASNVATGRNIAGVHWRSDARESLRLGEAAAISVLRDQRLCYNEQFAGFSLTKFDGSRVIV